MIIACVCGGIGEWIAVAILIPLFGGCIACVKKHLKRKKCDCKCHNRKK